MPSTTFQTERYDLLVLGSGEAGKYIAWTMASAGKKAAVIERHYIGGSCPNIACLPSKNIIYSAKVAHLAKQAADFGLPPLHESVNMAVVRERKRAMVSGLIAMHEDRFSKNAYRADPRRGPVRRTEDLRTNPLKIALDTGFHSLVELLVRNETDQNLKNRV